MTLKKKKLVTNIIFYTAIAIIYGFVIFQLVVKFNGDVVYLFGTRYDVVLTDSMSQRNENHLDFLEGTTQIQPYDVVRSKQINDNTELKLKDVVLFKNPDLGGRTVMHRIAEIVQKSDTLNAYAVKESSFKGIKTMTFETYSSFISLSDESLKSIEIEFLSNNAITNAFSFKFGGKYIYGNTISTKVDDYYINSIVADSGSAAEMPTKLYPIALGNVYVTKVIYTTNTGKNFEFKAEDYRNPETEMYETPINAIDFYKLRGDKAKDFDCSGHAFAKGDLISKVDTVVPKLGYVVSFLSSIPGIILLVGLAILITAASYFYNKIGNKKLSPEVADSAIMDKTEESKIEENKEDETKS